MKKLSFHLAFIASALLPLSALATPVVIGDREWQQPDLLTGFSWNDIAEVCPTDGGLCSGALNAVDVTGWRWATVMDVAELFATFDNHPGNRGSHTEQDSLWAPQLLSLFTPTFAAPGADVVFGWTRSYDVFGGHYSVYVLDSRRDGGTDMSRVRRLPIASVSSFMIGAWLFRDASISQVSQVPEPSVLALMALGCVALIVTGRRRRAAPAFSRG